MSLELGLCIGMGVLTFIFAYFHANEKEIYLKWFYLILTFGFMTASLDMFRRIATDAASSAGVIGMLTMLTGMMLTLTGLMIIIFTLYTVKMAIEFWYPKEKSFRNKRGDNND